MINWAITFLLVAIVAALFGFGGIAGMATEFAVVIFYVAVVLLVLSVAYNLLTGRRPPTPPV